MRRRAVLGQGMTCGRLSPRLGNVKNNEPSLIERVTTQ
jgi:hypothetical protein